MPPENTNETPAPTPKGRPAPVKKIKVRVLKQPVHEEGNNFKKGEVFETTPERAEALGDLVVVHEA